MFKVSTCPKEKYIHASFLGPLNKAYCSALQDDGKKMWGSFTSKQNGNSGAMQVSGLPVITGSLCTVLLAPSVPLTPAHAGNNLQRHCPSAPVLRLCLLLTQETMMFPLRPLHFSLQALLCFARPLNV